MALLERNRQRTAIPGSIFATVFVKLVLWVYTSVPRIRFIDGSGLGPKDLAVPGALVAPSPHGVPNLSENFENLFEMPVLFRLLHRAVWFIAARAALGWLGGSGARRCHLPGRVGAKACVTVPRSHRVCTGRRPGFGKSTGMLQPPALEMESP